MNVNDIADYSLSVGGGKYVMILQKTGKTVG